MIKPVKNLEIFLNGVCRINAGKFLLKAIYIAAYMDCHRTVTSCFKDGQTKGSDMDWG